jgi:hypothetical protein
MTRQASTAPAAAAAAVAIEVDGQHSTDPFDIPADLSPKIQPEQYSRIFGIIQTGL